MPGAESDSAQAQAQARIGAIVRGLGEECGDETELLWSLGGLILGSGLSLYFLSALGKAPGLSAPGITSGLAALGALAGGGMLAGLVLLLLPPALCSVAGYALADRKNRAQAAAETAAALNELRELRGRLLEQAESFSGELRAIDLLLLSLGKR